MHQQEVKKLEKAVEREKEDAERREKNLEEARAIVMQQDASLPQSKKV